EQKQSVAHVEVLLVAIRVDGFPLDVLHDDERLSVIRYSAIEKSGNVRMVERREDLPFDAKSPQRIWRVATRSQQLDRDLLLVLAIRARCQVNASHSAMPDL